MIPAFLTATGIFIPPHCVDNSALVSTYNQYAQYFNVENAASIEVEQVAAKLRSDEDFILRHAGIEQRYYVTTEGVLDADVMCPLLPELDEEQTSLMAEMGKNAALDALNHAGVSGREVDLIIVAASHVQRPYPSLAIEIQQLLGATGLAFDLCGAECSAVIAMQLAHQAIGCGSAHKALIISPEIGSAQTDFRDRDTHYLLGDACSALLLENTAREGSLELLDFHIVSQFSNQIRNNFGFLNRLAPDSLYSKDKLFHQTPPSLPTIADAICTHVQQQLTDMALPQAKIAQFFLQPTNKVLNDVIARQLLNVVDAKRVPDAVAKYGATAAAGLGLSFHINEDLGNEQYCMWVGFGAGFSVASVVMKKC